ncbi:hypothetical protein VPHD249_0050 [Vibrio phage D249]|nr:hypothetical protein SIPHO036v1_140004 [Vibrio phage 70E38.1]QZI87963.1 hypothetical protein SIPHO041v1_p0052 [Vibrio phage 234P1]QZI88501.1 hypothetical protein SIPHO037v1_p0060 [Vibrio phage 70E35.2]QZI88685.1 hypothetical protein SIPHO039v1_p0056 [Vibrio phage 70E35.5a]QZI88870.1 hypothetical protein SIPHO040v1_p0057 [Vibrio phage 70E35.6]QZI89151.1 hypothetical protein SIPHO042v1_p0154 [Vibrio phage 70E37.1]QZI89317.1 hypothetical protein SIPHO038v1_p0139 [Vibrio phage 70E37.6]
MEIQATDPKLLDPRLADLPIDSKGYQKIAKAALKRKRKAQNRRSRQRNAKNGHVNAYKLTIINDMFAEKPRGHAFTNSHGRKYYTLDGSTVRID